MVCYFIIKLLYLYDILITNNYNITIFELLFSKLDWVSIAPDCK